MSHPVEKEAFTPAEITTVVLAAGVGKRLGGPKALLAWPAPRGGHPIPLAIAHAEERLDAESGRVLVVTRKPVVVSLLGHVRPGIDLLASDAADDLGAAGSLAFALPRLADTAVVVVTPVDTPPARPETVARLLAALARYGAPSPPPLRDHLQTLGPACAGVDVSDPAVLVDINTPADVMGTLGALPRFLK
jgi:molybdenum cofactor cytidylyltransferase